MLGHSLIALAIGALTLAPDPRQPRDIPTAVPAPDDVAGVTPVPGAQGGPPTHRASDRAPGPARAAEHQSEPTSKKKAKKKKKKNGKPKVAWEPEARIMAGGEVVGDQPTLFLQQARVGVDARADRVQVQASLDLADALQPAQVHPYMRDAWGNVKIHRAFQIKVGRFKRPFSRLELRGVWKHAFVGRGLFNAFAIERRDWGDRAVGAMVWGRVRGRGGELQWAAGVSSPCPLGTGCPVNFENANVSPGITAGGRLEYDPVPWFSVGVNGAYKYVRLIQASATSPALDANVAAAGADLRIKAGGFYGAAEVDAAQDWRCPIDLDCTNRGKPWMLSGVVHLTYTFRRKEKTTVGPVVIAEIMDADLRFARSEAVRAGAGVDIRWGEHVRVLPQVDVVQPLAGLPTAADGSKGYHGFMESSVAGLLMLAVQL